MHAAHDVAPANDLHMSDRGWTTLEADEVVTALGYKELVSVVAEDDAVTLECADGMRIRIRVGDAATPGLVYERAPAR